MSDTDVNVKQSFLGPFEAGGGFLGPLPLWLQNVSASDTECVGAATQETRLTRPSSGNAERLCARGQAVQRQGRRQAPGPPSAASHSSRLLHSPSRMANLPNRYATNMHKHLS